MPCSDAAGVVEEVGAGSSWQVGDRVILHPNKWIHGKDERDFDVRTAFGGEVGGTLTQYMVVEDHRLIRAPDHLSFEEASTLPTAGTTAVPSLFLVPEKPIGKNDRVLIQGTGGVSTFAIQVSDCLKVSLSDFDFLRCSLPLLQVRMSLLHRVHTRS